MPDALEFLTGFGLIQGSQFDGYILSYAHSTHETVKRYQEYRYNITLKFSNLGLGMYEDLFQIVNHIISKQHIIYGVRNPYRCIIDSPKYGDVVDNNDGTIIFNLVGHSYRMYK